MPTPAPNCRQRGFVVADDAVEAFAMTMRPVARSKTNAIKFISWYITKFKDGTADKVDGTQTALEDYESAFI